jgi:hypothetical protein
MIKQGRKFSLKLPVNFVQEFALNDIRRVAERKKDPRQKLAQHYRISQSRETLSRFNSIHTKQKNAIAAVVVPVFRCGRGRCTNAHSSTITSGHCAGLLAPAGAAGIRGTEIDVSVSEGRSEVLASLSLLSLSKLISRF